MRITSAWFSTVKIDELGQRGDAMETARTVAQLCQHHGIDARQLAEKSGLEEGRVAAIILGRWTPSPAERAAVARVFDVTPDQIVWGHTTPVQHIYGSGPA
jgi:transcriptional regulator with XRE-family HTH domain